MNERRLVMAVFGMIVAGGIAACFLGHTAAQSVMAQRNRVSVPIAMYHSVTNEGKSPSEYVVTVNGFESDLKCLKERGCHTVTVMQLVDYVENGTPLPENPVMLTFDDGFYNNYANVYPLLKQYGMTGVLSPVASQTELFSQAHDPEEHEIWSYCTEQELAEMAQSGVIEIQNHSYDFHALSPRKGCLRKKGENEKSYEQLFIDDTTRAQALFADMGITEPICYTYPYGACSAATEELTEQLGLLVSLGCEGGENILTVGEDSCLRKLRRYNRDGRTASKSFWSKVLDK